MENQFLIDYLFSQTQPVKEFQLLQFIEQNHPEFFEPLGTSPSLYKKHFLLFHRLYGLKQSLLKTGHSLMISALEIQILMSAAKNQALSDFDPLAEFYLTLENLYRSDEEILAMQQQFWMRYLALDKKAAAIKTLGMQGVDPITADVLKKHYNQLIHRHHPDKGGNAQRFIQIQQAYSDLKTLLD